MKSKNLIIALDLLSKLFIDKEIAMIEFEDGSGYKFNYMLVGETKPRFADLSFAMKSAVIANKF